MESCLYCRADGFLQGLAQARSEATVLEDAGWDVVTHPAFTEGTKSFSELPIGIIGRILDLKKALEAYRKK